MSTSLFGSNGVRGIINKDLTAEVALHLGKAVGRTFAGTVAVATDARASAHAVRSAMVAGIMAVGADVIDLGIIPTPALQHYVGNHPEVAGGVMITASHNPQQYNGLKLIMQDGVEANRDDEAALEAFYNREIAEESCAKVGIIREDEGAIEDYVNTIISNVDAEAIRNADLSVCVDCASGAASYTTPLLLKRLNVRVLTIGSNPVGTPTRESDPVRENISGLIALTSMTYADLGIAHDSDGGRSIFVDNTGRFLSGSEAGALVAKSILSVKKGKVVTPVSSSQVLKDIVEENGGLMKYTEVGSHEVIRKMIENKAVFGVEENGGMVFPDVRMCRDGGMALAKMLEIIAHNGPLSDMVKDLPVYYTVKRRVECPDSLKSAVLEMFINEAAKDGIRPDVTDGVKAFLDDGWILLRPSTTEPYFRVYSESKDKESTESSADAAVEKILRFIEERQQVQ